MNNNTFIHKYIKPLVNKNDVCLDMTLGNGNDSFLLCDLAKKVYGFDISKRAIESSKQRLNKYNNIEYINDNHINVDDYILEPIKLAIFNLGFLPHSDEISVTKAEETLIAFEKVYKLIQKDGYIIVTFYLGHKGGKEEYYLLDEYINKNRLLILETYKQEKIDSPITYIIKKTN